MPRVTIDFDDIPEKMVDVDKLLRSGLTNEVVRRVDYGGPTVSWRMTIPLVHPDLLDVKKLLRQLDVLREEGNA